MIRPGAAAAVMALCIEACASERPYAGAPPPPPPPASLPDRLPLKTPEASFTDGFWVALAQGRLWIRPNPDTTSRREPWRLFGSDGFARHADRVQDGPPPVLRGLSADGDNLAAFGDDGLVYYRKWSEDGWISRWGLPPFGDALRVLPGARAVAMSHRGPAAGGYEDIDGNFHPVSAGVTTLYALSGDGRTLRYADPWLDGGWNHRICLPEGGRFVAVALAASASTVFVIDEAGRSFTRLADYDTLGDDPVLGYTWSRGRRSAGGSRTLPGEPWQAQPPVPGRITGRLTILQTGRGNAARELRIEGLGPAGEGGTWRKALAGREWSFVASGLPVSGPFLANPASGLPPPPVERLLGPGAGRDLPGRLDRPRVTGVGQVALLGFDPECPPATLRLVGPAGSMDLPLHLVRSDRAADGRIRTMRGAVLLSAAAGLPEAGGAASSILRDLFGEGSHAEVALAFGRDGRVVLSGDAPGLGRRLRMVFAE